MKEDNTYSRLLPIKGAYNMRDLGGYPTADGKQTKWRLLLRSGDLNELTDADLNYLANLPLRTDIDFRSKIEKDRAADKMPNSVQYYIPLPIEAGDMSDMLHFNRSDLSGMLRQAYVFIVKYAQDDLREFFRILADEKAAPLLFHCSAGKDRTGIAAALLLFALGVDKKTIMNDYMLSAEYIKGKYDFLVKEHPEFEPLTTVKEEYLNAALTTIDQEYGGMENYLTNHLNVDRDQLRRLYTE